MDEDDTRGLEREVVDWVARSTVWPRWEEEVVGGAIVEEQDEDEKLGRESDWTGGVWV